MNQHGAGQDRKVLDELGDLIRSGQVLGAHRNIRMHDLEVATDRELVTIPRRLKIPPPEVDYRFDPKSRDLGAKIGVVQLRGSIKLPWYDGGSVVGGDSLEGD
jgi:hypothetical protein